MKDYTKPIQADQFHFIRCIPVHQATNKTIKSSDSKADTVQKMKFSIKDFFSKCEQIRSFLWSHLLKKSLMENFVFCAMGCIRI